MIDKQALHSLYGNCRGCWGACVTAKGSVEGVADPPASVPEGEGGALSVVQQLLVGFSPGLLVEILERKVGDTGRRIGAGPAKEADVILNLSSKGVGRHRLGANDVLAIGRSSHCAKRR